MVECGISVKQRAEHMEFSLLAPNPTTQNKICLDDTVEKVERLRVEASLHLDPTRRVELGQFLTPPATAQLLASFFEELPSHVHLLDAGAGVGSLSAAFVAQALQRRQRLNSLHITAYEIDAALAQSLHVGLEACRDTSLNRGVQFHSRIIQQDFIESSVQAEKQNRKFQTLGLFDDFEANGDCVSTAPELFDAAILNPPYYKIGAGSRTRQLLRSVGIETSNLYAAFVWLAMRQLKPGGQLVAITPRSWCNGPYFKLFRQAFFAQMRLRHVHVFESRSLAFGDDEVLQENILFHAVKEASSERPVMVATGKGPLDPRPSQREVAHHELVRAGDSDCIVHIVPDEKARQVAQRMKGYKVSLLELGLSVSTGRVVDFRAKELLRQEPEVNTAPLIYPGHFCDGFVDWPKSNTKKPNALALEPDAAALLVPSGFYVLVKRFSAKEERRRIVAAVYDPRRVVAASRISFENHLNYYHQGGKGLPELLAKGLCAWLNSSLVDAYFRQFSGHTQVNASDLRVFKHPSRGQLEKLGEQVGNILPDQEELDGLVNQYCP